MLPYNASFPRVIKEATVLNELIEQRLQNAVEFVCFATPHILMVVKVDHFHRGCMFRRLQVTLKGMKRNFSIKTAAQMIDVASKTPSDKYNCLKDEDCLVSPEKPC